MISLTLQPTWFSTDKEGHLTDFLLFLLQSIDRICHLCNSDVGDEFHYIFNCTSLSAERNDYIPSYYTNRASAFSFFHLFSTKKISLLCKLCKYLQIVIERVRLRG